MHETLAPSVVACWYEYWRLASGDRAERKALEMSKPGPVIAAHRAVEDLVEQGESSAVQALTMLAQASPDGDDGAIVGISPMEDLLYIHGDDIVGLLLDAAQREPALARALAYVSLADGSLSPSLRCCPRPVRHSRSALQAGPARAVRPGQIELT